MSAVTDKASQATKSTKDIPEVGGKKASKSVSDTTKDVSDAAGKASSKKDDVTKPRTIPNDSESASQVDNTEDDTGSEMVPAAGKINEKGEVVDDEGKVIGKVNGDNAKKLAGSIVTQDGDILDQDGGVVGQAEPLDDVASELGNYTTKSQSALGSAAGKAGEAAGKVVDGAKDTATNTTEGAEDTAKDATKSTKDTVDETTDGAKETAEDTTEGAKETAEDTTDGAKATVDDTTEGAKGTVDETTEKVDETAEETAEGADETVKGATGDVEEAVDDTADQVEAKLPTDVAEEVIGEFQQPFTVDDDGKVQDEAGKVIGTVADDDAEDLAGKEITEITPEGQLLDEDQNVLGEVDIKPEDPELLEKVEEAKENAPDAEEAVEDAEGKVDETAEEAPDADELVEGAEDKVDETKEGADEAVEGAEDKIDETKEDAEEAADGVELPDVSVLEGLTINKLGNVVDKDGKLLGKVKEGEVKKLIGKTIDDKGQVWDNKGNVIGQVEVLPEAVENLAAPFEDFPDATVDKNGKVIFEGRQVGVVVGDDFKNLIGKKVDADGDILDKNGNVIGKAERQEAEDEPEPEEPEEEQIDYSSLRDKKVNKAGNVVDDKGSVYGHVVQGILKHLIGKKVGENGEIFNDAGKVIGKAEPIPESEREDAKEDGPFEDFPDAVVENAGKVMSKGEQVGVVVEGDAKKLKGKKVDSDGDITDKAGNVLGKAERWEPEEEAPEPEVDRSALAGKRINKAGNAVDKSGEIYGRVIEGDLRRLVGKMCDKTGAIRNEGGDIIGKAELIPEAEREGMKEGPFTELQGCTVTKEGKVVTPGGDVVGRLVSGDPKVLFGRSVDDDGDICDKNGNVLGKAERWEEPEEVKDVNPMSGRKVNREGNVVDENGDVIGKLTSGQLSICAGKKIDDDGDVVDSKGSTLGHVSLLEDIPEPEPEPVETETEEEKQKKADLEKDRKLAGQMASCIEQSLDKIKPICKMITNLIDKEERKKEDDRDEEELVKQVRPLIEEGGKILTEANGAIRGLDPDGRISANAKHKTAAREATPEEYRLADLLKELTGSVTECIDNAKRKIEDMPHAKKELNPLWGLLAEPLGQILAAVGLLLSGVLGLVGKLLSGLGLGGLLDNLLGGLGLTKILDGLGLGSVVGSLTGKKK